MKSTDEIVRDARFLRELPPEQVDGLLARASFKDATRGSSIHLQGERAHSLYVVVEGWVKLYRMTPCGSEAVVAVLSRGESFGEIAALPGEVYATGAESVSDARLIQIDGADLLHAVARNADLCRAVLSASLESNRQLVQQLEQLKSHTGAQRIADFLLDLCKDETGSCTVVLPYDKVLIASCLGMKPESLSRSFRRLADYGVRIVKDRAIIQSVERLMEYTDEDPSSAWSAKTCKAN